MKAGFFEVDITPRVGVGLCGFGSYLNRYSIGVRDVLKARAAAFEQNGKKAVIVSCDLIGVTPDIVQQVKQLVAKQTAVPSENIMLHCTHTHSGPNTGGYIGWGNEDEPYLALLPGKIVKACAGALDKLQEAEMLHAVVPCEGIGLNREYDKDAPPLEDVLRNDWRPAKPELTDTKCHVLKFIDKSNGQMNGFMAYFGCHPVVCCQLTRYIHGDYCGVAMNNLERENPGSVGLFLQGAQGDVNSCVVHKPEKEALLALDVIAARFANSVRHGLQTAKPVTVDKIKCANVMQKFSSKEIPLIKIKEMLAEKEAIVYAEGASDENNAVRMAVVTMLALRSIISRIEKGEELMVQTGEIQGIRIGPVEFLGAPFEIMQAIKNEVVAAAKAPVTLVMGITNGSMGYAPDKTAAARGGYAADTVPMIVGRMPFLDIHTELVNAFLETDCILSK
ncbi:MAG: neutral/alkaline non-lysosomal ceramidase N-terminal domain-containing protein [Lentisphaerota bacterium]